jgi:hypothetical protein
MIKFREQVPNIYTSASRDFQYLSWLIDIVLNSVKHNVDSLYNLPDTQADSKLTELLAMTLGFKVKRNYDQKQLAALVAVLPRILKYKGTEAAILMAGKALIAASGTTGNINVKINNGEIEVVLPKNLVDVSLFTDLLTYISPAGMTYKVIRVDGLDVGARTDVKFEDTVLAAVIPDFDWNAENQEPVGLSNMFSPDTVTEPSFANYNNYDINTPNIGLLDNSIITALDRRAEDPKSKELTEANKQANS